MAGEEDYALAQQRMSSVDQEVPEEDAQLTFAGSQTAIKSWRRCGGFRAFPHCCKSLGMSTFEAAEVDALARAGNAAAAKTWLGD